MKQTKQATRRHRIPKVCSECGGHTSILFGRWIHSVNPNTLHAVRTVR